MNEINQNIFNILNIKNEKLKKDSAIEKNRLKINIENMPSQKLIII